MADRKVKYELSAEDQAAIQAFKRVQAETRAAEKEVARLNMTTGKHGEVARRAASDVKGLGNELKGVAATVGGIAAVTGALSKMHETAKTARAEMAKMGGDMRELAMGAKGGTAETEKTLHDAARIGKKHGFTPGDAAQITDWAEDATGSKIKGKFLASSAMRLEEMGVAREDVQATMPSLMRQGYHPERAADLIAGGMAELGVGGKVASKIAARGQEFGGAENAMAAAKVLRAKDILTDKEVGGAIDSTAGVLSSSKLADALRKKYKAQGIDYDKASMSGKLADIETLYGSDAGKLQKKFGLDETGAKSLSTLIQNRGMFDQEQQSMVAIPQGYATDRLKTMRDTPALHEFYAQRDRAADRAYGDNFGARAKALRNEGDVSRMAAKRYEGNRLTRSLFTEQNGELNWMGTQAQFLETNPVAGAVTGFAAAPAAQSALGIQGPGRQEMQKSLGIEKADLDRLTEALNRNSSVTEANSKATAGTGGDGSFGGPIDRNAGL